MTGKALLKILREKGSTTVVVHAGEDLGKRLLKSIVRDLEPCLGKDWLKE